MKLKLTILKKNVEQINILTSVTDTMLSLLFCLTIANVYANQVSELLYELKTYNLIIILAGAAYYDTTWFQIAKNLSLNLLIDANMRRAKSIESFTDEVRYKNTFFIESPIDKKLYKQRIKIENIYIIYLKPLNPE